MIKLLRVDSRLLHGQIAVSWTNYVGTDCILVAGDHIDPMIVTIMKMSKPAGMKLVIKTVEESIQAINSGKTDKYKLFILVESVTDAYRLATACPQIKGINVGRTKKLEGTMPLNDETWVTAEEKEMLRKLCAEGYDIQLQMIPTSKSVPVQRVL